MVQARLSKRWRELEPAGRLYHLIKQWVHFGPPGQAIVVVHLWSVVSCGLAQMPHLKGTS